LDINSSENEILKAFDQILPYLPSFFDDEISVALTNKDSFIRNQACKSLPLKSDYGDPIPEGGAAAIAIKTGKVIVKEVSKEIYGAPFKSYAVPIKGSDGEVVGSILIARNLERSKRLFGISKDLAVAFGQISDAVNGLSEAVQKLALTNKEIADKSEKAAEFTDATNEVLSFIQKIATQSNLLGLNAAIEASRAGDAGRGFQVVSQEIRKMSANTTDSVKKINKVLNSIENYVNDISKDIKESNSVFQGQIATLEEITASMTELDTTVKTLKDLSEQL
jgi:uncharacterized protein YoxC